jgi:DnaJ family protein A protein 2
MYWQKLEKLLPQRPKIEIPSGEDVEEVNLVEFEESRGHGSRREAYDDDDDDDHHGHGPRVQCAHQ